MAGKQQGRVGDIGVGICPNHDGEETYTTIIISGIFNSITNSKETATIGSVGCSSCGHPTIAISGARSTFHQNKAAHRVGDIGINYGPYNLVSGSENTFVGD